MRNRIGPNYLNNNDFINLFMSLKQDSLNEVSLRVAVCRLDDNCRIVSLAFTLVFTLKYSNEYDMTRFKFNCFTPLQFGGRKMGDVTITNSFRERLEREMDGMQASLQQINEANKPPPPRHDENRRNKVEQFFHRTFGW